MRAGRGGPGGTRGSDFGPPSPPDPPKSRNLLFHFYCGRNDSNEHPKKRSEPRKSGALLCCSACSDGAATGGAPESCQQRSCRLGRSVGPCKSYGFLTFFDPGLGGSVGPREAPLGYLSAFPGPPGASRRPPRPKTNQSQKPRNLKELAEQWSRCRSPEASGEQEHVNVGNKGPGKSCNEGG